VTLSFLERYPWLFQEGEQGFLKLLYHSAASITTYSLRIESPDYDWICDVGRACAVFGFDERNLGPNQSTMITPITPLSVG
jgi:hypothetical protein